MATTINAGRVAMVPKGEWSASTAYVRLDVVSYHGSSYVCKQDCTGQNPSTATNYWQLLSSGLDPTVDTISAKHYEGSTVTAETSISAAGVISKTASGVTKTYDLPAESGTLARSEETLPNKTYAPLEFSGLGRKYLQKNIVSDKNVLTQAMLQDGQGNALTNYVFVVQYDYDLNGQSITIPAGCTLQFDGGSVSNGTIVFSNTTIEATSVKIFEDLHISGTLTNTEMLVTWWGVERIYTITTSPTDASKNTDALAVATNNTSILNTYVIPDLNVMGVRLVIDVPIWINDALSRIYGFDLYCIKALSYQGDDFLDGGVVEIGGSYRHHRIILSNNYRESQWYTEYYTNGVLDPSKEYDARSESNIVGLLVRGMALSTVDIEQVSDFTTGVMVKGGYGSPQLPAGLNYVSYSTFNVNAIMSCLRAFVVNFDSGWLTECVVNKGRYTRHRDWLTDGNGHGVNTAITFEDTVSGTPDSTSNWVFNAPCIEGAGIGIKLDNVTVQGSQFNNVRNENVQASIYESDSVKNATVAQPSVLSFYGGNSYQINSNVVTYSSLVVQRQNEVIDVAKDVVDLPFKTIFTKNSNNGVEKFCVENMMIMTSRGRLYDSLSGTSSYMLTDGVRPIFHQYYMPCVIYEKGSKDVFYASIYYKKDIGQLASCAIFFLDSSGDKVSTAGCIPGWSYDVTGLFSYDSTYSTKLNADDSFFSVKITSIPNGVERIVIGFFGYINSARICVHTANERVDTSHGFKLNGLPDNVFNAAKEEIWLYNTSINKHCHYDASKSAWVDESGYVANPSKGTTANRPTFALDKDATQSGFEYYDTTLEKAITYTAGKFTKQSAINVNQFGDKYISNPFANGEAFYGRIIQGEQNNTIKFIFAKTNSSTADGIEYDMTNLGNYSGSHYAFETDILTAPDPTVYPYICISIGGTGNTTYKFFTLYAFSPRWIEADGAVAGVLRSGTTANRPARTDIYVGFEYFDTGLGLKVVWNGSAWIVLPKYEVVNALPASPDSNTLYLIAES